MMTGKVNMTANKENVAAGKVKQASGEISPGKHLITMIMGSWLIVGVFIDGFAHNHGAVETFFTPWHAVLYSGFLACAAWISWLVYANVKTQQNRSVIDAIPNGYGLGAAGVILFLVGGMCDMIWHIVFGIEENIAALLSPTHLMLLTGSILILSSPFRAAWVRKGDDTPSFFEFLPTLLSITLVTSIMAFFLMYAWSFGMHFYMGDQEDAKARAFVNFLITTMLLITPILLLLKRWRLPFGAVTLLFSFLTGLMAALNGFERLESIIIVIIAGVIGDLILWRSKLTKHNVIYIRVFAFVVPIVIWSLYFIHQQVFNYFDWPPELWGGTIFLCGLCSLGLSVLAISPMSESSKA